MYNKAIFFLDFTIKSISFNNILIDLLPAGTAAVSAVSAVPVTAVSAMTTEPQQNGFAAGSPAPQQSPVPHRTQHQQG